MAYIAQVNQKVEDQQKLWWWVMARKEEAQVDQHTSHQQDLKHVPDGAIECGGML